MRSRRVYKKGKKINVKKMLACKIHQSFQKSNDFFFKSTKLKYEILPFSLKLIEKYLLTMLNLKSWTVLDIS